MRNLSMTEQTMAKSAIGTLLAMLKKEGKKIDEGRFRIEMAEKLVAMCDEYSQADDTTEWTHCKRSFLYDVYLAMRQDQGTITEYDLIRPGLTITMFAESAEYYKHKTRVADALGLHEGDSKTCSVCGVTKPLIKFKRRGGSKCLACQRAQTRANAKPTEEESDEV